MKIDIKPMDPEGLFEVHQYTDDLAGTIIEKTPVKIVEGRFLQDPLRASQYLGQTFINGTPINFPLQATTLTEALSVFAGACEAHIEELQSQALKARIATPGRPNIPGRTLDGKIHR